MTLGSEVIEQSCRRVGPFGEVAQKVLESQACAVVFLLRSIWYHSS